MLSDFFPVLVDAAGRKVRVRVSMGLSSHEIQRKDLLHSVAKRYERIRWPKIVDRVRKLQGKQRGRRAYFVAHIALIIVGFGFLLAGNVYGFLLWGISLVPVAAAIQHHSCWTIATIRLLKGRCAACDYPLAGLPIDEQALTICSECGAAWCLPTELTP